VKNNALIHWLVSEYSQRRRRNIEKIGFICFRLYEKDEEEQLKKKQTNKHLSIDLNIFKKLFLVKWISTVGHYHH
jgi:hypothetical protein